MRDDTSRKDHELSLKEHELKLRERELALRQRELSERMHSEHNLFLRDTRARIDSIVRALLLLSGGALTVSIGILLRKDHLMLPVSELLYLGWSWTLLFAATLLSLGLLTTIGISSALHGRRWTKWLDAEDKHEPQEKLKQPSLANFIGWPLGLAAVVSCAGGLALLAHVAIAMVKYTI